MNERPLTRVLALPVFATALTVCLLVASALTASPSDAAVVPAGVSVTVVPSNLTVPTVR